MTLGEHSQSSEASMRFRVKIIEEIASEVELDAINEEDAKDLAEWAATNGDPSVTFVSVESRQFIPERIA